MINIKKDKFPKIIVVIEGKETVDVANIIGVIAVVGSFLVTVPCCYFPLRQ